MGKTIGYIVALVVVIVVIYLVATGGKDEEQQQQARETPSGQQLGAGELNAASYSGLLDMAANMRKTVEEARAQAPDPSMVPDPDFGFLTHMVLEDKGTVVRTEESMGRGVAWVDLNGDGQPDLQLQFGARPVPENISEGVTLDLVVSLKRATMSGDSLQLVGEAKKAEPVGGN